MKIVTVPAMGIVLALGIGFAAAQEHRSSSPADEDLIRWIGDACPSTPDLMAVVRLDQVAGKAVTDWLRTGRYRDAQRLAARYLDCLRGLGLGDSGGRAGGEGGGPEDEGPAAPRIAMLEQVLCFLPLVIFEVEQRVDADMTAQCLARCPRPPEDPPGDRKVWGESVRRYLHLVAAVRPPAEVLKAALSFLEALRKAGFPFPDRFPRPPRPHGQASSEAQDEPASPATPGAAGGDGRVEQTGEAGSGDEVTGEDASGEGSASGQSEDEDPDPVFAAMVLGIGAAVAAGDLDGLLRVVGAGKEVDRGDREPARAGARVPAGAGKGPDREAEIEAGDTADDDACSSAFLAALGVMQAMVGSPHSRGAAVSRRAALPILQTAIVSRAPFEARMRTVRATLERFGDGRPGPDRSVPPSLERPAPQTRRKPCVVPQVVASLVLASLDAETFDRAVADGRAEDLALVVSATSIPVGLPGSADSRFQVLRLVADRATDDEDRGRWLCALGDAALAARRVADAAAAFGSAASLPEGPGRSCGARGRLRALVADPTADPDRVTAAARAFLETGPDAPDVYGILAEASDPRGRIAAIKALCEAGRATRVDPVGGPGLVEAVMEALIKVVDSDPGSQAARLALDAVGRAGGPARPEDRAIWGLVSARHHLMSPPTRPPTARHSMSRQEREANRVLKEAFSLAGPDTEGVQEGTAALLRWLAANDHVRVLDRAVALARTARVVEAPVLAQVGAIRGERGDRRRAKALLRQAILARPSGTGDWLTIADAYARIDEPALASAALDKAGPEASWDRRHYMIRGRIEMDRRRYREAAAAYTRASDLSRGECEPLFFRGLVRLLLGDAEGAAQDFERCMALGEGSSQVLGGLAYAHFDQSAWDRAEQTFREALAKDEATADNHVGLAMTLFRQGRLDEARQSFERAVELEPAMKKGYAEAERKGYVYTAIEKKAWTEMVRAFRGPKARRP